TQEEKLLFRFWNEKNNFSRTLFFNQMQKPEYKIPIAVLMAEEQEESVFKNYIQTHFKEVAQFLFRHGDEENSARLLAMCR
ncbi:MAG: hypothetical protein K2O52_01160, partial [Oscillospiraceae bacterium]|nr:hypothetical protein [Oscillospiraceae bacterium]